MSLTPSPRRWEVPMDKELEGQSVLITGSTHGIGRAMATLFAQEGANVVITGRSRDEGRALEEEIDGSGGRSLFVPMDVTIEADVQNAVAAAVAAFGGLTTLVNNAAWGDPFVRADDGRYVRRMMESGGQSAANFWAPVLAEAAYAGELVDGLNLAMAFDWLADVGLMVMGRLESNDQTVNGLRAMLRSFVVPAFTKAVTSPQ